jgi:hypothetical protein
MNHLDINPLTNKHQWIDSQLLPLVQAKERRKEAALPSPPLTQTGRVPLAAGCIDEKENK